MVYSTCSWAALGLPDFLWGICGIVWTISRKRSFEYKSRGFSLKGPFNMFNKVWDQHDFSAVSIFDVFTPPFHPCSHSEYFPPFSRHPPHIFLVFSHFPGFLSFSLYFPTIFLHFPSVFPAFKTPRCWRTQCSRWPPPARPSRWSPAPAPCWPGVMRTRGVGVTVIRSLASGYLT